LSTSANTSGTAGCDGELSSPPHAASSRITEVSNKRLADEHSIGEIQPTVETMLRITRT
jgi:hypothetical protein